MFKLSGICERLHSSNFLPVAKKIEEQGTRLKQKIKNTWSEFFAAVSATDSSDRKIMYLHFKKFAPSFFITTFSISYFTLNFFKLISNIHSKELASLDFFSLLKKVVLEDCFASFRISLICAAVWTFKDVVEDAFWNAPLRHSFAQLFQPSEKEEAVLLLKSPFDGTATDVVSPFYLKTFQELSLHYALIRHEVASVEECNQAIQATVDLGKKIKLLYFKTHGNKLSHLYLGEQEVDGPSMCQLRFDLLEPDATILLSACKAGAPLENSPNMAEWIQLAAGPERIIYAAKTTIYGDIKLIDATQRTFKLYRDERCLTDITFIPNYQYALKKRDSWSRNKAALLTNAINRFHLINTRHAAI